MPQFEQYTQNIASDDERAGILLACGMVSATAVLRGLVPPSDEDISRIALESGQELYRQMSGPQTDELGTEVNDAWPIPHVNVAVSAINVLGCNGQKSNLPNYFGGLVRSMTRYPKTTGPADGQNR